MQKIIYLKFDELYLKGQNIKFFKQKAISNLRQALHGFSLTIKNNFDNIVIADIQDDELDVVLLICKRIPGFTAITVAVKIAWDLQLLKQVSLQLLLKTKTFKVEAKRTDKSYEHNSDELKRMVAGYVLYHHPNIKVDIHNPETMLRIEVKHDGFIVFTNKLQGAKGLPVGTSGRALMLLSGGIDSPVASDLLMRRGMHVDFITFITPPHTTPEALDKVKELVRLITLNYRLEKPKLYVCNFTPIQNELTHIEEESYKITLLRRSFIRIANQVASTMNYDVLATGEALGQVASQTIESMKVIDEASKHLILRPLVSFNKDAIINHAKEINTYTESIKPFCDSCSLFAPRKPVTKPKLHIAKSLEDKLDLLMPLEDTTVKNIEVISYDKK